jgi:hypothetical protein
MKNDRAGLVQDAEVHGPSVQINSAVMRMLLRIESHWPPPLFVALRGRLHTLGW